jgi:hypothetical protein
MTRRTLPTILTTEGGLSTRLRQAFVSRTVHTSRLMSTFRRWMTGTDFGRRSPRCHSHDLAAVFAVYYCRLIYERMPTPPDGRDPLRHFAALPHPAWDGPAERTRRHAFAWIVEQCVRQDLKVYMDASATARPAMAFGSGPSAPLVKSPHGCISGPTKMAGWSIAHRGSTAHR